jgi:hypothetical protein
MTPDREIRADLEPDAPGELVRLAERLQRERPVPSAGFRGELRRRLLAEEPGSARPRRLRALISSYAAMGTALLVIGALSAAGAGPLAA